MNELAPVEASEIVAPNPMDMIQSAVASGADVAVLERLMALQERWEARNAQAEFSAAKAAAMAEMPDIPQTGKNDHTKRAYSTLRDITTTTRPVLSRHGLTLSHAVEVNEGAITVTAILAHANGHKETTALPLPFDTGAGRNAVQAIGSSQTYGQRYTAQAILGLSLGEDSEDDGAKVGASASITADQFQALQAKIADVGADEDKLVAFFKVEHLHELPQSKYGTADAMLDAKKAKNGGIDG